MVLDPDVMACPPAAPRNLRRLLEMQIERAIDLLDALDGDAEAEAEMGLDQDENPLSLNPLWQRPATHRRRA